MYFLAADLSAYTFTASETENFFFKLTNLKNYYPDIYWRSSIGGAQTLNIDFGSATVRDVCVIDTHNMDTIIGTGDVKLQAADDSGFTSGLTTMATIATAAEPLTAGITSVAFSSSIAKRYWRLNYDGVMTDSPILGQIFIEKKLEPFYQKEWGYRRENLSFKTKEATVLDGRLRTSQPYSGRLLYEIGLPEQNDTFSYWFDSFYNRVKGKLLPWYFVDGLIARLVYLEKDMEDKAVRGFGRNKVNVLRFKTQKVGLTPAISEEPPIIDPTIFIHETEETIITVT